MNTNQLVDVLSKNDAIKGLLESVLNQVLQTRDGSFKTEIFKRYQRSEQAFFLGIMEMNLEGVSCRKVTKITEQLCGCSFSKSTVSQLCVELDAIEQQSFCNFSLASSFTG